MAFLLAKRLAGRRVTRWAFLYLTARIIDRSTQEKLMDAAATYAGSFVMFLDTEF